MPRLLRPLLFPGLPVLLVALFPLARPAAQGGAQPEILAITPAQLIAIPRDSYTRVAPPVPLYALSANATATFTVNYTGFSPQAQAAFQAAVDVWSNLVTTTVPIVINAQFTTLGSGVLGSAGTTYLIRNFTGAPESNTWYPAALANARAGVDLDATTADIGANFNSSFTWYFGTDGNTPPGQYDFMSVVLHELGHGLGFAGSATVSGGIGMWGFTAGVTTSPMSYDRRVVNGSLQELINTGLFPNPSAALANQLQSNNLFWNGAAGIAGNAGTRPRLYAPATWQPGSSYSHLDEVTYPAGNPNSLMTYAIGSAESIHSPGPIALGILTDIGWGSTGSTCNYTLGATSTTVGAAGVVGATVGVTATPGCAWTAVSNSPGFITVTGGAGGTGSGAVTYSVAANGGPFRSGTMTIAGQTFTVGQNGIGPTMTPDKVSLRFGATSNGTALLTQTSAQVVRLTQTGAGLVTWTATSNRPWLQVTPASGSGSANLSISVASVGAIPASGSVAGAITLSLTGAGNSPAPIAVTLTTKLQGASASPFGFVDTPTDLRTGVTGAIPFTGWALDDVEVARVSVCRAPFGTEVAPVDPNCGGYAQIFVGFAVFIDGARPDVAAGYPTYPVNTRAGWGFMVLTNMLPNQGNGTYVFQMWAQDREGNSVVLGTRTMTCANATATLPFGAIDTPAQGGVASGGAYVNFGWALTPLPKTIPTDGSTITVLVDGVPVGTAIYNNFRTDIATLFPGLNNSNGAVGFRVLDTTTLTNGTHTIVWVVSDDQAAAEGIGSRFFTVSNGAGALTAASGPTSTTTQTPDRGISAPSHDLDLRLHVDRTPVLGRRGWDLESPLRAFESDASGRVVVRSEEVNRVELRLGTGRHEGYLRTSEGLMPLPIGSQLDGETGVFTWAPGVGFVGAYDFVFVRHAGNEAAVRRDVRIVLQPKGSGAVGPQVVIDTPRSQQDVGQPFVLAGWAADLNAAQGTGIATLHAWAYPLTGGPPVFLGATDTASRGRTSQPRTAISSLTPASAWSSRGSRTATTIWQSFPGATPLATSCRRRR